MHFGFPGIFSAIPRASGYDDIVIAGPGMEFPLWSWNGESYAFSRNIGMNELSVLQMRSAEELSQAYLGNRK